MARFPFLLLGFLFLLAGPARAEVVGEALAYRHGDVELEGWLARDPAVEGRRPAILICHAWMGQGAFEQKVAEELAARGYVTLALDMYGKGVRAKSAQEAAKLAGLYKGDRALMRARARAGLDVLRDRDDVDPARIVAIGFCFGGTTVLELARDGADVQGAVSFHGGLATPSPAQEGQMKTRALVLHGGDDPHVPPQELSAFWEEMRAAKAAHEIVIYSGAVHSFTNPEAGDDTSRGVAYDANVSRKAWERTYRFFEEQLGD